MNVRGNELSILAVLSIAHRVFPLLKALAANEVINFVVNRSDIE